MHRDTKLGLALAILVMGFAAALCFPRVPDGKPVDLVSLSAREIDPLIERGQVKVYTDADRPQSRGAKDTLNEQLPEVTSDQGVLPVTVDSDPTYSPREPEPTPIEPADFPAEVIAPPEQVVHTRTYTVVFGDTLTDIAKKEWNDASRYREIFNANRDQLSDLNSILKPKMVLVIPISDGGESSPASEETIPVATAQPVSPMVPTRPVLTPINPTKRFGGPRSRVGSTINSPITN
jgi:LysM domain